VRRAIYDSSLIFGMPYSVLLNLARCESALNPRATDGVHYGLFQFLPSTFREGSGSMRSMTGITAANYWRPLDSAYVAGYLFATGHSPRWQCETQPNRVLR
jgi:Transglycosylase SLT domain